MSNIQNAENKTMKVALIIVDLQNDFLDEEGFYGKNKTVSEPLLKHAFAARSADITTLIDNILELITAARRSAVPIAYITAEYGHAYAVKNGRLLVNPRATVPCRPSTWGARLVDRIGEVVYCAKTDEPYNPADEIIIRKHTYDGFFQTELLEFLKKREVEVVVVAGAETNVCVMRTAETAALHQFFSVILDNCVWSSNVELANAALRNFSEAFGWVRPGNSCEDWAQMALCYSLAWFQREKPH